MCHPETVQAAPLMLSALVILGTWAWCALNARRARTRRSAAP